MRSKGYKCYNYHCKGRIGDSPCCGEPGDIPLNCVDRVILEDAAEKRCATCKWRQHEDVDDGYVCVNDRSDFCCDWTDDDFSCEKWEAEDG